MNGTNNPTAPIMPTSRFSIDDYFSDESLILSELKRRTKIEDAKGNSVVLKIHKKTYDYFLERIGQAAYKRYGQAGVNITNLFFLFVHFANPKSLEVSFTEKEIGKILGVSERTVQRYVMMGRNWLFNVLSGDNLSSFFKNQVDTSVELLPNTYKLSMMHHLVGQLENLPEFSPKDSWVKIKIEYKGIKENVYFKKYFYNNIIDTHTNKLGINGRHEEQQIIDSQLNKQVFEHFKNPIYKPGFDTENTLYPGNWTTHPDPEAHFTKGRWYGGAIHNTRRGGHRKHYLRIMELTKEIDMHNAMFYFMVALLPNTVSKADKKEYCKLAKEGKLYEDALNMIISRPVDSAIIVNRSINGYRGNLNRDAIKEMFQKYRNRKGGQKKRIGDIDWYFQQRFPTIREWLVENKEVMQNRLSWIETDFMSLVCEKLSAENIKYEWLHDAVYVSEENSVRAQEVWDSVRDEFEAVFMSK